VKGDLIFIVDHLIYVILIQDMYRGHFQKSF